LQRRPNASEFLTIKQVMACGDTLSARKILFVGEAFSLDRRGWNPRLSPRAGAAPTAKDLTYLEGGKYDDGQIQPVLADRP
jgi:hypothetical protein